MAAFRLTSPAFGPDEEIPERYTADGDDLSPPLTWEGVPDGTKELVLICEDPDAETGVVTHWVVYGIAPDAQGLVEGVHADALVDSPVPLVQGLNEFDEAGYTGPTVEEDRGPHRLFFRIHALDIETAIPPGVKRPELREAASGHIIDSAELVLRI